jgi:hypothetical protein
VQPDAALLRDQPHEGVMGLPNLFGQLFDIAAGQFRIDSSSASIVELDLDSLEVNHGVPFVSPWNPS